MDLNNQSAAFPSIPSDQNPYLILLQRYRGSVQSFIESPLYRVHVCACIGFFSLGILLASITLILRIYILRKTNRPFHILEKLSRSQGNYYIVDYSTFVPLTVLAQWTAQLIHEVLSLRYIMTRTPTLNSTIVDNVPLWILYIQGQGLAFSILVKGIAVAADVRRNSYVKLPPPWFMNSLQIVAILILITTHLVIGILTNASINYMIYQTRILEIILVQAVPTWLPNSPLNPSFTSRIKAIQNSIMLHSRYTHRLSIDSWIAFICTSAVPLSLICISGGFIIWSVHSHTKSISNKVMTIAGPHPLDWIPSPSEQSHQQLNFFKEPYQLSSPMASASDESASASTHMPNVEQLFVYRDNQRAVNKLARLRQQLTVKLGAFTLGAFLYLCVKIAFGIEMYFVEPRNIANVEHDIYIVITDWLTIVYGYVLITHRLYLIIQEWRECPRYPPIMSNAEKYKSSSSILPDDNSLMFTTAKDIFSRKKSSTRGNSTITTADITRIDTFVHENNSNNRRVSSRPILRVDINANRNYGNYGKPNTIVFPSSQSMSYSSAAIHEHELVKAESTANIERAGSSSIARASIGRSSPRRSSTLGRSTVARNNSVKTNSSTTRPSSVGKGKRATRIKSAGPYNEDDEDDKREYRKYRVFSSQSVTEEFKRKLEQERKNGAEYNQ